MVPLAAHETMLVHGDPICLGLQPGASAIIAPGAILFLPLVHLMRYNIVRYGINHDFLYLDTQMDYEDIDR
jgi:hypothetical protein